MNTIEGPRRQREPKGRAPDDRLNTDGVAERYMSAAMLNGSVYGGTCEGNRVSGTEAKCDTQAQNKPTPERGVHPRGLGPNTSKSTNGGAKKCTKARSLVH